MTVWLSPDALKAWKAKPTGRRGAQPKFSDLAIETAVTLRLVFHLPLRQAEGFLGCLFKLMEVDLEVPDHTTLSRCSALLKAQLASRTSDGPIDLIIDSSGLAIAGEGEWAAAKHRGKGRRGYVRLKAHLPCGRCKGRAGCGSAFSERQCVSAAATAQDASSNDQAREGDWSATMEGGVWVPPAGSSREHVLPLQGGDRRTTPSAPVGRAGVGGVGRVQPAQSDPCAWMAHAREGGQLMSVGMGGLHRRPPFMHQRPKEPVNGP